MNNNEVHSFRVTVSMSFDFEGSDLYVERFTMTGVSAEAVRRRVRIMVSDRRYMVAVSPI